MGGALAGMAYGVTGAILVSRKPHHTDDAAMCSLRVRLFRPACVHVRLLSQRMVVWLWLPCQILDRTLLT